MERSSRASVISILRHSPEESPGLLAPVLDAVSAPWRLIEMWQSPPPEFDPSQLAGLIVLGGAMNADEVERYPFLTIVVEWLRRAVAAELPVLGICLGAQLLAQALGAQVRRNHVREIGWRPIEWLDVAPGDPLLSDAVDFTGSSSPRGTTTVFQWHGDTFDLPLGSTLLARSTTCEHQAFRFGTRAWGVQFHPEVTEEIIERWLGEHALVATPDERDDVDALEIRRRLPRELPVMHAWSAGVFRRFADICRSRPARSPHRD